MIKTAVSIAISLAIAAVGWTLITVGLNVPDYLVPSMSGVARAMVANGGQLTDSAVTTLSVALSGIAISVVVAIVLASASFSISDDEGPLISALIIIQSIPVVALVPILNVWLGNGDYSRVLVASLFALFPLAVAVARGLYDTPADLVSYARAIGCSRVRILVRVLLPAALTGFFVGLRVAVPLSLVGAIVAELTSSAGGLGVIMINSQRRLDIELLFAAVLCAAMLGLSAYVATLTLEKFVLPWKARSIR